MNWRLKILLQQFNAEFKTYDGKFMFEDENLLVSVNKKVKELNTIVLKETKGVNDPKVNYDVLKEVRTN